MLRYQLNPHFLFNTLNAISTLVLDNQNRTANLAVSRLSEFLRYTLDQDPMKKVTLRQELDALNLYLGIEKLRFGDRLRLEFDVDERAESALVPSLLLQPLVENAMKYAIAPREQGGAVTVIAGIEGGGRCGSRSWTTGRACRRPSRTPTAAGSACATRANGSRCCTATRTRSRWPTPRRDCASRCGCRWRSEADGRTDSRDHRRRRAARAARARAAAARLRAISRSSSSARTAARRSTPSPATSPDLMFLDIEMPGIDGFEVLRRIPQTSMPMVVFVTAFDRYAIEAFDAHALDYLLKPLVDERLERTLGHVREQFAQRKSVQAPRAARRAAGAASPAPASSTPRS